MTTRTNPFNISFGKEPSSFISREAQLDELINDFLSLDPVSNIYILTGVRGVGKTVSLMSLANQFEKHSDWIVLRINPVRNILSEILEQLKSQTAFHKFLSDTEISLSMPGITLSQAINRDIKNTGLELSKILKKTTDLGKSVLLCIDEAVSSENFKEFATEFQIWMGRKFRVFVLMTGLYENIQELQDEKNLTFLYRAPKVYLSPLNMHLMAQEYQKVLGLPARDAITMAQTTKGYSYAYQTLGYLCFKNQKKMTEIIHTFDWYLAENVYSKLWSELSGNDQEVMCAAARAAGNTVKEIRTIANMNSNLFGLYRKRLINKGLLISPAHGQLEMALPRFKEFIVNEILFLFEEDESS